MLLEPISSSYGFQKLAFIRILIHSSDPNCLQSIMPLHLLVPSLQRVNAPSASDASIHPMHAFLTPLLLSTRSSANKYHTELPQILSDGGGAGEMEETMMWYALTHEKADEETQSSLPESADGPWVIPKWRQKYLERMERRE